MATSVTNLLWKLRGVPATEKVVLVRLGDFGREDGTSIFPAVTTVAADCGLSDRAVQQVIKKHLATGVLVLISDARGGRGRTSEYAIDLNRVRELIENPEQASPFKRKSGPSGASTKARNTEPRSPFSGQNPERHDIKGESGALNPEPDSPNPLGSTKEQAAPAERAGDGWSVPGVKPKAEHVAVGERIAAITGWDQSPNWFGNYSRVVAWLKAGWSPELDILPTVERLMAGRNRKGQGPPRGLDYFEPAIADAYASRTKPLPGGDPDVRQAQQRDPVRGARPASGGRFAEILQRDLAGRA